VKYEARNFIKLYITSRFIYGLIIIKEEDSASGAGAVNISGLLV